MDRIGYSGFGLTKNGTGGWRQGARFGARTRACAARARVRATRHDDETPTVHGRRQGRSGQHVGPSVQQREEKNKRIWDLREKRHKGVEKGDKAFLESLY